MVVRSCGDCSCGRDCYEGAISSHEGRPDYIWSRLGPAGLAELARPEGDREEEIYRVVVVETTLATTLLSALSLPDCATSRRRVLTYGGAQWAFPPAMVHYPTVVCCSLSTVFFWKIWHPVFFRRTWCLWYNYVRKT